MFFADPPAFGTNPLRRYRALGKEPSKARFRSQHETPK